MSLYQKGLLLYNSKAGNADVQKNVGVVAAILADGVKELTIIKGQSPGDLESICTSRGEEIDILFVMGGDGTVHECINGLMHLKKRPIVSILPGGTCNDFARSLNVPMNIAEAALLAINERNKYIDIGYANGRYFTNFIGIGLITETSENINEEAKEWTGSLSYLMSAMKTIKEAEPFEYDLMVNKERIQGDAVMIVAMNGTHIGTNELPFESLELDDEQLNIFIVKKGGIAIFSEWVQRKTAMMQEMDNENMVIMKADEVSIDTSEQMKADTDGEIYLQTPLNVKVIPLALRFIIGENNG
ncbi:diacylglycerol/lipid kinase family protein [Salipaludibacillus sp. HK11]|uniref:diacylglycerol/lipid kinase family protein n=1 Tax=Salipaludibacillus sp. HK11 TaxID=3394320 RepID=UPI0039FCB55F